jgi:peptide/nickel transport system ATP-binding protein
VVTDTRELLRVEDATAGYVTQDMDEPVRAVEGVSLTVYPGEVLGIAGESGCGKSSLAAVLALNARPPLVVERGTLIFGGLRIDLADPRGIPADWRGKQMSLLPQGAMNALNPTARVGDLAVDVIRAHEAHVERGDALARVAERLGQLSLPIRVLQSYPHQLSGGMRQRVVAAISTLLNPKILIADEPTSALDVSSQRALVAMLVQLLQREFIRGIVFISHDLPLLTNIAHRIAIMYAGKIVEIAPVGDIVDGPAHPYTRALIGSALVPDPSVRRKRVLGIPGAPPDLRDPPNGCRFHPRCPLAMPVCSEEEPPLVGDGSRSAACWAIARHAVSDFTEVVKV